MNRTFRRFARQTPSDAKNAFFGPPSRTGWEGKSWGFRGPGIPSICRSDQLARTARSGYPEPQISRLSGVCQTCRKSLQVTSESEPPDSNFS